MSRCGKREPSLSLKCWKSGSLGLWVCGSVTGSLAATSNGHSAAVLPRGAARRCNVNRVLRWAECQPVWWWWWWWSAWPCLVWWVFA
ncbi:hypothetical protein E2C01_098269 [Portunus trituberculatus]|uniref:Uncharacterized protein n=1 Tax=Portunus trituberculatus TaxID=210409 RepID=A0A5B7K2L0_PORTR|nr:hypothetical protein [Portunus trituberculatus]